jgi:hypothetical protein
MQPSLVNSSNSYELMIFLAVCTLAVGFMLWFLVGLIREVRKANRLRLSRYRGQLELWVSYPARDDFDKEAEYAGHSLDSSHDRFFRRVYRLRPLLRPREVTIPRLRKIV